MKRLFAIMMALAMMLSLSVTAFADAGTNGSIKITNATDGETYNIYKIFEATYTADATTYTITSEDPFFTALFGADGTTANEYFTYHATTGVVSRKAGNTDAQLFEYLANLVKAGSPTASEKASGTTVEFKDLTTGYYVIRRENSTTNAVTITTTKPNAEVHDKDLTSGKPDKKVWDADVDNGEGKEKGAWVEANSAKVGDIVNFQVKFQATNYDDGKKVTEYAFTDTLSTPWADIDTDHVVVKVGGTTLAADAYTVTPNGDIGFDITIPWVKNDAEKTFKYPSPVEVEVLYSATVLEAAASANGEGRLNTVDPEWDAENDSTTTKVYNMGFIKVDGTDTNKALQGAQFELYSDEACNNKILVTGSDGVYTVTTGETGNTIETPADGKVVIMGLKAGTYYLKETKAPDGYNQMDGKVTVTIDNIVDDFDKTGYTVNFATKIENFTGVQLPSTGGEGTMKMITIGTIIAIGFAVLLITNKKMTVYQD